MVRHLDLFSGIGGFAVACQWNGIETIGFVEIDKYCQKVLRKHWPNVSIVENIRDVKAIKEIVAESERGRLAKWQAEATVQHDVKCRDNKAGNTGPIWRADKARQNNDSPTLLITAGFPCQPFSVAGKRQGERDDRYLWPQTIAVIKEVQPQWVLLENVTGIINLALDTVLSDLESAGYATETLVIPACAVNAWHRRDRIWIVGYAAGIGLDTGSDHKRGRYILDSPIGQTQADKPSGNGWELWISKGSSSEGIITNPEQSTSWRGRFARRSDGQGRERATTEPTSLQSQDGKAHPNNLESGSPVMAVAQSRESRQQTKPEGREDTGRGSTKVAITDTQREGLEGSDSEGGLRRTGQSSEYEQRGRQADWWTVEPELGRVAHGISNRVDRLKCLGNAIVPQVAYEIIKAIKDVADYTV